jgi:DNA-binding transcriptional LysR family regulator
MAAADPSMNVTGVNALSAALRAMVISRGAGSNPMTSRLLRQNEGEDLLVHSRRLLSDMEALAERASALKTGEVGVLRIGATPQVIETLLAEFLPRYRTRHPGVEVPLIEDGGARFPGRLERGDLHVAIMPAG